MSKTDVEMKYKYIRIVVSTAFADKPTYYIKNKKSGAPLGYIDWYHSWRQWVAWFESSCVFSADCLRDIQDAMEKITALGKDSDVKTQEATAK